MPAPGRELEGSEGDTATVHGGEQQQGRSLGSSGLHGCARVDRRGRGGNEHAAAPRHLSDDNDNDGTEQQSQGRLWLRSDDAW